MSYFFNTKLKRKGMAVLFVGVLVFVISILPLLLQDYMIVKPDRDDFTTYDEYEKAKDAYDDEQSDYLGVALDVAIYGMIGGTIIMFIGAIIFSRGKTTRDWENEARQWQAINDLHKAGVDCPICGSDWTRRISTANRATSIFIAGLASSKIGKQYECLNCKHKW